jgi:hypothetical protein
VPVETGEEMGSFLLLPDGFAAAFHRPVHSKAIEARGRVARLDAGWPGFALHGMIPLFSQERRIVRRFLQAAATFLKENIDPQ